MVRVNAKVKILANKRLGLYRLEEKLNNDILRALQAAYDLGHADGFARGAHPCGYWQ